MKRSASSGEETFPSREKILPRIAAIQRLKERYSPEEMAKLWGHTIEEPCRWEILR